MMKLSASKKRSKAFCLLLASLTLLTSCATLKRDFATPEDKQRRLLEVLNILTKRNYEIESLEAQAEIGVSSGFFAQSDNAVLLVQKPHTLRIDLFDDFGTLVQQMSLNKEKISFYWPTENTFIEEAATEDSLEHYFSLPLAQETGVLFLLGGIPLEAQESYNLKLKLSEGCYALIGQEAEIWVDRLTLLPIRYKRFKNKERASYTVWWKNYEKIGDLSFPTKTAAKFRKPWSKFEVQFSHVTLNKKLSPKLLQIRIPRDATPKAL